MASPRTIARSSVAALILAVLLLFAGYPRTSASALDLGPAADAGFLSMLNTLRVGRGLAPLAESGDLSAVARSWSSKMVAARSLSHNPALTTEVKGWEKVGENVGTGSAVATIFGALVASPPHLKNMYDPGYTRIGIGSVSDSGGSLWTTHVFMRPRSGATAAPAAVPVAAAPVATTAPPRRPASTTATVRATPAPTASAPGAPAPVVAAVAPAPTPETSATIAPSAASSPGRPPTPAAAPTNAITAVSAEPSSRFPVGIVLGALGLILVLAGTAFFLRRGRSGSGSGFSTATEDRMPRWYGGQPMAQ